MITDRADGTMQGEQVKQSHERFRTLREVGYALRLKRVYHPEQRAGQGQAGRHMAEAVSEFFPFQRPPDYSEQNQAAQEMHRHVEDMVAADVEALVSTTPASREGG